MWTPFSPSRWDLRTWRADDRVWVFARNVLTAHTTMEYFCVDYVEIENVARDGSRKSFFIHVVALHQRDREHLTQFSCFDLPERCLEMKSGANTTENYRLSFASKKKIKIEFKFSSVCNKVGSMHSFLRRCYVCSRLFNLATRIAKRIFSSKHKTRIRSHMERSQII